MKHFQNIFQSTCTFYIFCQHFGCSICSPILYITMGKVTLKAYFFFPNGCLVFLILFELFLHLGQKSMDYKYLGLFLSSRLFH